MSLDDCRGSAWAFRQWMRASADDIQSGKAKGAIVKYARPHPKRTLIGPFAAKLLRFGRKKEA